MAAYNGTVQLASGITQKNGLSFMLVDSTAVNFHDVDNPTNDKVSVYSVLKRLLAGGQSAGVKIEPARFVGAFMTSSPNVGLNGICVALDNQGVESLGDGAVVALRWGQYDSLDVEFEGIPSLYVLSREKYDETVQAGISVETLQEGDFLSILPIRFAGGANVSRWRAKPNGAMLLSCIGDKWVPLSEMVDDVFDKQGDNPVTSRVVWSKVLGTNSLPEGVESVMDAVNAIPVEIWGSGGTKPDGVESVKGYVDGRIDEIVADLDPDEAFAAWRRGASITAGKDASHGTFEGVEQNHVVIGSDASSGATDLYDESDPRQPFSNVVIGHGASVENIDRLDGAQAQHGGGHVVIGEGATSSVLAEGACPGEDPAKAFSKWTVVHDDVFFADVHVKWSPDGWVPYAKRQTPVGSPQGDENSTSLSWEEGVTAGTSVSATRDPGGEWTVVPQGMALVFDDGSWVPCEVGEENPIGPSKGDADSTSIVWTVDGDGANDNVTATRTAFGSVMVSADTVVIGNQAKASGDAIGSVVVGGLAEASGRGSVAIGQNARASGDGSIVVSAGTGCEGGSASAVGKNSVVIGGAVGDGESSVLIGFDNESGDSTTGDSDNVAIGHTAVVRRSSGSIAIGSDVHVGPTSNAQVSDTGYGNVAIGLSASIQPSTGDIVGSGNVAIGYGASVAANDGSEGAVQIGSGRNTSPGTFKFKSYQLFDSFGNLGRDRLGNVRGTVNSAMTAAGTSVQELAGRIDAGTVELHELAVCVKAILKGLGYNNI